MNAPAAGNALNSLSLPVMKIRSTARNAAKPREIHRHSNSDLVRHRVFAESADNIATVR
jgi:hypothetical protein